MFNKQLSDILGDIVYLDDGADTAKFNVYCRGCGWGGGLRSLIYNTVSKELFCPKCGKMTLAKTTQY